MIKISIQRSQNHVIAFSSKGHAEYSEGDDIVCAAVSVLTVNTVNSIEKLTSKKFSVKEKDGYLNFRLIDSPDSETELLLQSMIIGLQTIEKEYGSQFVNVTIVDC